MSHLPADLPADAPRQKDPVIEEEARQDKENAQLAAPALLQKWKDGPPVGKAYVWYWWHFWGRAEVWRMTLHFAQVPYEFCGFTNDEYDAMRPLLKREGLLDAVNALSRVCSSYLQAASTPGPIVGRFAVCYCN